MNIRWAGYSHATQRGFTLIVAILLLLVLTIFSLSALNVGVFEQRTSANDYRSKVVHQVAEVGLNHAAEAIRILEDSITPQMGDAVNAALWQRCAANDQSFPCGAETDQARRGNMYRYVGGVDLDNDGTITTFERRSINFPLTVESGSARRLLQTTVPSADPANPFTVQYAVGALLCRIDVTANPGSATNNNPCTAATANAGRLNAITLVSRAEMVGEQATATVSRTIVPLERVGINPKVPAITAGGLLTGVGSSTIVGNPNAGGSGVAIAIWARNNFSGGNGSWQTCHLDDWIRDSEIELVDGEPVCGGTGNSCLCESGKQLSGGGMPGVGEGIDVLDVDNNVAGTYDATTKGTLMDSQSFPCDMWEFVFGEVKAREDTNGDGYCEDAVDANGDGEIDSVLDFIRGELQATELTCAEASAQLNESSTGAFWIRSAVGARDSACALPARRIGRPANPVVLIVDGGVNSSNGMQIFGLVFGTYDKTLDLPLVPDSNDSQSGNWSAGGGQAEIYGAVVLEGGGRINGNVDVIYNRRSLGGGVAPGNPVVGEVPGSWTDRYSY